ncbi:MAG: acyltransferase [Akkermansiaceae bacterium]|nr:acyltransferase [Armatimonadota bacterium]
MSGVLDTNTKRAKTAPTHLGYLDGLRGSAALYVLLHHAVKYFSFSETIGEASSAPNNTLPASLEPVAILLNKGIFSVPVFIALSGFCLMLPVVKAQGFMPYSAVEFLSRRAKRLIPPYYFAIALSLLLTWLFLSGKNMEKWAGIETITSFDIWAHLLLVHDLFPATTYTINYPLWSIATEWHIYFFFPPLIYLANRFGFVRTLTAAYAFCFLLYIVLRLLLPGSNLIGLFYNVTYLGVFASGMLAAHLCYSPDVSPKWKQWNWGITTAVLFLVFIGMQVVKAPHFTEHMVGLVVVSLLIYMSTREETPTHRFLGSKPMVFLGIFSYSVYLMHAPLLQISWHYVFSRWDAVPALVFWSFHLVTTALILLISYFFHCCFERPFFNKKQSGNIKRIPKPSEA